MFVRITLKLVAVFLAVSALAFCGLIVRYIEMHPGDPANYFALFCGVFYVLIFICSMLYMFNRFPSHLFGMHAIE